MLSETSIDFAGDLHSDACVLCADYVLVVVQEAILCGNAYYHPGSTHIGGGCGLCSCWKHGQSHCDACVYPTSLDLEHWLTY